MISFEPWTIAKLEKNIAVEIVNNEINVENDVTKKLTTILETHIGRIQKQKRIVTKLMQDNESAKHKCQVIKKKKKYKSSNALDVNRFLDHLKFWVRIVIPLQLENSVCMLFISQPKKCANNWFCL